MTEMFAIFVEPFQFAFMQNALLTALVVAVICALLSCYLVLKGWSLMGDAISHAVLPGIVLAFLAGIPLVIGAFVSGIACALGVGYLKENSRIKENPNLTTSYTYLIWKCIGCKPTRADSNGYHRLDYFYFAWLKAS